MTAVHDTRGIKGTNSYELMNANFVFLLRMEIREYLPPQEEVRRNIEEIYTFCVGQIATMHSLSPQETKTKFIGEPCPPNHQRRRCRWSRWPHLPLSSGVFQRFWPACLSSVPTCSWLRRWASGAVRLHAWSALARRGCCFYTRHHR